MENVSLNLSKSSQIGKQGVKDRKQSVTTNQSFVENKQENVQQYLDYISSIAKIAVNKQENKTPNQEKIDAAYEEYMKTYGHYTEALKQQGDWMKKYTQDMVKDTPADSIYSVNFGPACDIGIYLQGNNENEVLVINEVNGRMYNKAGYSFDGTFINHKEKSITEYKRGIPVFKSGEEGYTVFMEYDKLKSKQ